MCIIIKERIKILNAQNEYKSFFGKKYKTWVFEFSIDYGATSIDLLKTDFQLVPFVTNLDEEAKFEDCVFITEGKKLNIIFEQVR